MSDARAQKKRGRGPKSKMNGIRKVGSRCALCCPRVDMRLVYNEHASMKLWGVSVRS